MTGLYAEPLPAGFGFSETAFRIFVLMASRRLKSDRFFTDDYRPEIYTEFGLDYVKKNSMLTRAAAALSRSWRRRWRASRTRSSRGRSHDGAGRRLIKRQPRKHQDTKIRANTDTTDTDG